MRLRKAQGVVAITMFNDNLFLLCSTMGFPEGKGCWEATVSIHADLEDNVTEMNCSSFSVLWLVFMLT
jgi:hypothetical protein